MHTAQHAHRTTHSRHPVLRLTSMRHMPPFIAQIGECLWRAAHHKLPELCKERPPNVCVMQTYRRGRGDFMDYHTDSRQTYAGQTIAQARTLPTPCPPCPTPPYPTHTPLRPTHTPPPCDRITTPPSSPTPSALPTCASATTTTTTRARSCRSSTTSCCTKTRPWCGCRCAHTHTRHAHTHAPPTHTPMPHPPTRARTSTCYIHVHMHMPHPHAHMLHPHAHAHATCTCTHVTSTCTCTCHMCMCTLHPQRDDHRKKHGVWWAPGTSKDAVRHVLVFRWTNVNAKRAYYTEYPHRPVATGARMPMHRARMPCRCPCPSPCPSPCPWPCP